MNDTSNKACERTSNKTCEMRISRLEITLLKNAESSARRTVLYGKMVTLVSDLKVIKKNWVLRRQLRNLLSNFVFPF